MKKKTKRFSAFLSLVIALVSLGMPSSLAGSYYTDLTSLDEVLHYAENLNIQIESEGIVLLKNVNGALPLQTGDLVSVFGNASYESVWGETGGGNHKTDFCALPDSLEAAGLGINSKVRSVYEAYGSEYVEDYTKQGGRGLEIPFRQEIPVSLLANVRSSYKLFPDAAIVTIARNGHEDFDIPTNGDSAVNGAYDGRENAHALQLENAELAMLEEMRDHFDKVIVLLNVPSVVEIGSWANLADAIVYIGLPGQYGMAAVGSVLTGSVNPSGKSEDIWATDLTHSPSFVNSIDKTGSFTVGDEEIKTIEYEEGIYVGYKYYETVYTEIAAGNLIYDPAEGTLREAAAGDTVEDALAAAEAWYTKEVAFPFGFGLSYTSFEQTILTDSEELRTAVEAAESLDDTVNIRVKVSNTGDTAGKNVAELYVTAPYTAGGIEKAAVQLAGFEKSKLLAPGDSQELVIPVRIADIAAFDDHDVNTNGFKGYELEAGEYRFALQQDSHTVLDSLTIPLTAKTFDENGEASNTPFSDGDDYDTLLIHTAGGNFTSLSRAHLVSTFPTAPEAAEFEADFGTLLSAESRYLSAFMPDADEETDPWYVSAVPETWTQSTDGNEAVCTLDHMSGLDPLDTETVLTEADTDVAAFVGATPAGAWEMFLNSLSFDTLKQFLSNGGGNFNAITEVGLEEVKGSDGPEQLSNDGTFWACAAINAGTFNKELMNLRGVLIVNESLLLGYPVWYGPAVNIHRTHFNGRNYIYFSEDGYLSGAMSAELVRGAQSKGLIPVVKHIVLNDQETDRKGIAAFITEQALREIYLKPFEIAVKAGEESDTGMMVMTAMNRLGAINCYSNYKLLTEVLRNTWGFTGSVITDTYDVSRGRANYIQRTGNDIPYGSYTGENAILGDWSAQDNAVVYNGKAVPTQWAAIRSAAEHLLHTFANSNAMQNGLDKSLFQEATLVIQAYVPASGSIAVDEEAFGGTASYALAGGEMPEGVALTSDGELTGMAKKTGDYRVRLSVIGDGWVTEEKEFIIQVDPFLTPSAELTAKAGEDFSVAFEQDAYSQVQATDAIIAGASNLRRAEGEETTLEEGKVASFWYELLSDIPGLELSEDGILSGTPSEPGTYDLTIRFNYLYMTDIHGPGKTMFNIAGPAFFDSTYQLTVTGE